MSIEISHEPQSGRWSLSYKRNLVTAVGMLFLGAGLAALTGPWWQPFASALLGRAGVPVDTMINYWVAALLILIGLAILVFKYCVLDVRAARIASDKAAIAKSPPDIEGVGRYFTDLVDDHSYFSNSDTKFRTAYTQFSDAATQFQDTETASAYAGFARSATMLHEFVYTNFFAYPNQQGPDPDYRYCMAPHLNSDRDMVFYDHAKAAHYSALSIELSLKVADARRTYDAFIGRLKKLNHI